MKKSTPPANAAGHTLSDICDEHGPFGDLKEEVGANATLSVQIDAGLRYRHTVDFTGLPGENALIESVRILWLDVRRRH